MGLNEYAVLQQVWSGNNHAQGIAEATHFPPQLVKACLIRLERAHFLDYKKGYKPYVPKVKTVKQKAHRDYTQHETPIMEMTVKYMTGKPEGVLSREMSEALGVKFASLRNVLNIGIRAGKMGAKKGPTIHKLYYLL